MTPSPRLLLTIDYESWFALSRQYDFLPAETRMRMDEEIARTSLTPILDMLGDAKVTFYLVNTRANEHLRDFRNDPAVLDISRNGNTFCIIKQVR